MKKAAVPLPGLLEKAKSHHQKREWNEAAVLYQQIVDLDPHYSDAWHLLGVVHHSCGRLDQALFCMEKALSLKPHAAAYHYHKGVICFHKKDWQEALSSLNQALQYKPNYSEAYFYLGLLYQTILQYDDAISAYEKVLKTNPRNVNALTNLGVIYYLQKHYSKAYELYKQVLEICPDHISTNNNMGILLKDLNRLEEAIPYYKKAISVSKHGPHHHENQPLPFEDIVATHSDILLLSHYSTKQTIKSLYEAHKEWAALYTADIPKYSFQNRRKDKAKRLKIGYVSADFKHHPVSFLLLPTLACHKREHFEIYAYSNVSKEDTITDQLRQFTNHWRNISTLKDAEVADMIYQDEVDILIDLSGHTADNRLLVFARKPAPIQVAWLGYFNTTGMKEMDYFISDSVHTPPQYDQYFTEKVLRLPDGYISYAPPAFAPPVSMSTPAEEKGYITFGCFNTVAKINEDVVNLWSDVLKAVQGSRLVLKAKAYDQLTIREHYKELFKQNGITEEQVCFLGWSSHGDTLEQYHQIDIVLDPFPFSGGLTTLDALWMGVPVITLPGELTVSRQTATYLTQLGLPQLAAKDRANYVQLAREISSNVKQLTLVRAAIRKRMAASPLCDGKRFTAHLEAAYLQMWHDWCEQQI